MTRAIVDAGPLVALFYRGDKHHDWAAAQFKRVQPPLLTCEAVLSETCFLLRSGGLDPSVVLDAVDRGMVRVAFSLAGEIEPVRQLMRRYANIGASLADACIVRMSEIHAGCQVMTIDSDFLVYRRNGRRTIPLISPFDAR